MKNRRVRYTIEQRLLAVESRRGFKQTFIARTMNAIYQDNAGTAFNHKLLDELSDSKTFIQKLFRLPKIVLASLAVIGLFAVSGTVYAAYQLWQRPQSQINSVKVIQERVHALISVHQCGSDGSLQTQSSINPDSGLSPDDAAKVAQAHCEMSAIGKWTAADLQLPNWTTERFEHTHGKPVGFAYTVESVSDKNLSVLGTDGKRQNINVHKNTLYIDKASIIERKTLRAGDVVTLVAKDPHSLDGPILAVIKLDLPAKYYDATYQSHVRPAQPCSGNELDTCTGAPHVSAYISPELTDRSRPPQLADVKQIQGIVREISEDILIIETSSGRMVAVEGPSLLHNYNREHADPVGVGSLIQIACHDVPDNSHIPTTKITEVLLVQ